MTKLTVKGIRTLVHKKFEKDVDYVADFESIIDSHKLHESRAHDLANILAYDKEHYGDVNIETLLAAAVLAGIIVSVEDESKKES